MGGQFRAARERRGWSSERLALEAGISPGTVSRIENDRANPTWSMMQKIAEAMELVAEVRLTQNSDDILAMSARVRQQSPADRLFRQPAVVYDALVRFASSATRYAVVGSVAGLLQGLPFAIHGLHVLICDDEESLLDFEDLLLQCNLLFTECGVDWMRANAAKVWAIGNVEVQVDLVEQLPATVTVMVENMPIPVVPIDALLTDPEVVSLVARLQHGAAVPDAAFDQRDEADGVGDDLFG